MTENQKKIADLEELCKPVIEYLKENSDPYVEITITSEHIKVKRDIMSIPVAATECEDIKVGEIKLDVVVNASDLDIAIEKLKEANSLADELTSKAVKLEPDI